ncbi:MAG: hypothetical protein WC455_19325 [Dehalococcoidia bacterium]
MTTLSAVVVSYRRQEHLEQILAAWLKETPDVWLCDCSPVGFKTALPVHVIHARPDPGNRIRHAVALMTSGDLVIKADDDLIPLPGLGMDLLRAYEAHGEAIYGIHGRQFRGPLYYSNTRMWGTGNTRELTRVDFVGVITAAPRSLLPMDLRNCPSEVEDLYWQMERYPKVPKYVVPTVNVKRLPESFDPGRLCGNKRSKDIRQEYYKTWYLRNYAK